MSIFVLTVVFECLKKGEEVLKTTKCTGRIEIVGGKSSIKKVESIFLIIIIVALRTTSNAAVVVARPIASLAGMVVVARRHQTAMMIRAGPVDSHRHHRLHHSLVVLL